MSAWPVHTCTEALGISETQLCWWWLLWPGSLSLYTVLDVLLAPPKPSSVRQRPRPDDRINPRASFRACRNCGVRPGETWGSTLSYPRPPSDVRREDKRLAVSRGTFHGCYFEVWILTFLYSSQMHLYYFKIPEWMDIPRRIRQWKADCLPCRPTLSSSLRTPTPQPPQKQMSAYVREGCFLFPKYNIIYISSYLVLFFFMGIPLRQWTDVKYVQSKVI